MLIVVRAWGAAFALAVISAGAMGCEGESTSAASQELAPNAGVGEVAPGGREGLLRAPVRAAGLDALAEGERVALRWAGHPVSLETTEATGLALSRGVPSAIGDRLAVDRGAMIEEIEAVPAGVEQRWWIPEAPAGEEPLEVRVRVEGLAPIEDDGGIALLDPTRPWARLRYGAATWIDAAGRATAVPERVEGDAIVLSVPRDVVKHSMYPAWLDPVVSPELTLGPVVGSAPGPSVAALGTTYLAAWAQNQGVVAQRFTAAGALIDPSPVLVGAGYQAVAHRIVTLGQTFVIASRDGYWIHVRVMSPDGTFAGPEQALIAGPNVAWLFPTYDLSMATNGTSFLILVDYQGNTDLSGDLSGAFWGVRLLYGTGPGALTTVYQTPLAKSEYSRTVASDGAGYLVLYKQAPSSELRAVYSGAGAQLSGGSTACTGRAAAWAGSSYLAVSSTGGDLFGCRMDATGAALGAAFPISTAAGNQVNPRVSFDGANTLVAWDDDRAGNWDTYANWVSPAGAVQLAADFPVFSAADIDTQGGVFATGPYAAVVGARHGNNAAVRFIADALAPQGAPCLAAASCLSGFCVDGVCCDTACGNGVSGDCQSCSAAAGAAVDGTCGPVAQGSACTDGDACTTGDACANGACAGTAVVCAPPGECQMAGACNPVSGQCGYAPLADGTPCSLGACLGGACVDNGGGGAGGMNTGGMGGMNTGGMGGMNTGGMGGMNTGGMGGMNTGGMGGMNTGGVGGMNTGGTGGVHTGGSNTGGVGGSAAGGDGGANTGGGSAGATGGGGSESTGGEGGGDGTTTNCACRTAGGAGESRAPGLLAGGALALLSALRRRRTKTRIGGAASS